MSIFLAFFETFRSSDRRDLRCGPRDLGHPMGRGRGGLESEAMSSVRPPTLRRVVRVLTRGGTRPVLTAGCSGRGRSAAGGGPDSGGSQDPPSKYAPDPTAEAGGPPPPWRRGLLGGRENWGGGRYATPIDGWQAPDREPDPIGGSPGNNRTVRMTKSCCAPRGGVPRIPTAVV